MMTILPRQARDEHRKVFSFKRHPVPFSRSFRDGLDAMDTSRFPEATYGELVLGKQTPGSMTGGGAYPSVSSSSKNKQRALAICAGYKTFDPPPPLHTIYTNNGDHFAKTGSGQTLLP